MGPDTEGIDFRNGLAAPELSRRELLVAAAAAGVALSSSGFLAACGGDGGASGNPGRGGTLRVGLAAGSPIDTLDVHTPISSAAVCRNLNLNEGLTQMTPDITTEPALAEELSPNANGDVWTVRLRKGLEFHNGKTITADDVIFSLRRINDPKNPKNSATLFRTVDLNGLRKLDERTVEIPMTRPFAVLDESCAGVSCQIVPTDYDPKKPIGAGPFKWVDYTAGEQGTFARFENYFGDVPLVDEIVFIDLPDDTARVNALIGGDVDVIDAVPGSQVDVLANSGGIAVENVESGAWRPIVLNTVKPPFDDVRVRQAFRLIADRQQIVEQAFVGHAVVANDVNGRYSDCHVDTPREQDIEQAKSLLADAGQAGINIDLVTSPISNGVVETCTVFAEQAKAADVSINVRKLDPGSYFAGYPDWTFAVDYWPEHPLLSQDAYSNTGESPLNTPHFDEPEYNKLYVEASSELDPDRRCEIEMEQQRILYERGGWLIPAFVNAVDAHKSTVAGFIQDRAGWSANRWRYNLVGFTS
jgi:peptide/nickel transport system substrate-binding protein